VNARRLARLEAHRPTFAYVKGCEVDHANVERGEQGVKEERSIMLHTCLDESAPTLDPMKPTISFHKDPIPVVI
jgi:hypothetical protein